MESRRSVLKRVAAGASVLLAAGAVSSETVAQGLADDEESCILYKDGAAPQSARKPLSVIDVQAIRLSTKSPNGPGWVEKTHVLSPPPSWTMATVSLTGWRLRLDNPPPSGGGRTDLDGVSSPTLKQINWHDGGVSVSLRLNNGKPEARANFLVRDDAGDEAVDVSATALVTYYGS